MFLKHCSHFWPKTYATTCPWRRPFASGSSRHIQNLTQPLLEFHVCLHSYASSDELDMTSILQIWNLTTHWKRAIRYFSPRHLSHFFFVRSGYFLVTICSLKSQSSVEFEKSSLKIGTQSAISLKYDEDSINYSWTFKASLKTKVPLFENLLHLQMPSR